MTLRFFQLFLLLILCVSASPVSVVQARAYADDNKQAVRMLENGRYLEGIELLKKSLATVPHNESIQRNLLRSYLAAGRAFIKQQRYQELSELMLEAQEYDDTQRDFWSMRGFALLRLKQYFEAEADLQEARSMGDPDAHILLMLGKLYYQTDRMYLAFDALESAQLHAPDNRGIADMLNKVRRELAVERDMDKQYGGHFVITFDGDQDDDLGRDVLEVLEDAYRSIGSWLDHYPEQRVTVILYSRQQFSDLTDSPEWAGGLYDGKIRLPVGGISYVDADVRGLLYHEYMHVVTRDIAGKTLPYWLNEGLAEVAEAEFSEPDLGFLSLAREQRKLYRLLTLEGRFSRFQGPQVALAYQQSYSVVRFLVDDYGWHLVRDLLFALGEGHTIERAFEQAFDAYGLSYQRFEELWRGSG